MLMTIIVDTTVQPMLAMLGLPEMLVILAIVVVLFGASKLPQLGKGMGEAIGNFKKAQRASADEANEAIDATPKLTSSQAESVTTEFEQDKSNA